MNLHHLDDDPRTCARLLPDVWLQADLRELAQILGTACHVAGVAEGYDVCRPYNPGGRFVRWVLASRENAMWAMYYGHYLGLEFLDRHGKRHGLTDRLSTAATVLLNEATFPTIDRTPCPEAFDVYHPAGDTTTDRYRDYLRMRRADGLRMVWTAPATEPEWSKA